MVKYKLALPVLVFLQILQIFNLPQEAKCSSIGLSNNHPLLLEEIQLESSVNGPSNNPNRKLGDIEIIEVPNFTLEFKIPVQVFGTRTDTKNIKKLETPEFFYIDKSDNGDLNISQVSEYESFGCIEQPTTEEKEEGKIGGEYGEIKIVELNITPNIEKNVEIIHEDFEKINSTLSPMKGGDQENVLLLIDLTIPDILEKENPSTDDDTIEARIISHSESKNVKEDDGKYEAKDETVLTKLKILESNVTDQANPSEIAQQPSKRNARKIKQVFLHQESNDNTEMNDYLDLLNMNSLLELNSLAVDRPFSVDLKPDSKDRYSFYEISPIDASYDERFDTSKHLDKRSTKKCGCSKCSKKTDSSCSPEIIEKPTFIVEEAPEIVEKPSFKVTETSETITKPDFVVKEVTEIVPKPNYSVQEKIETVEKLNYVVEETSEKVKKPTFKIEEEEEFIVRPEFVIEETQEFIEKPEFTIEENVETVVKPTYKVEPQTETVEKPNYVVKEHVLQVKKPEFIVTEKTERVHKPGFKVEEKVEVVKKPKYQIKEEIVSISKPSYIVEEKEVVLEKPEFIVTEEILPVQKPHFLIKETQEVVEKPEYYVTEVMETVDKPNYLVEETQQTVIKPSYDIEDEHQTVKKPHFVVQDKTEFIVKPEFIVEETTIPVVKPEYIIEDVVENVQKPSYLVKPVPCYVEKPEFLVHEVVEKVNKPSFHVVEKKETIKKPSFVVEEDVQTVMKPCFNVVTCSGPPRRIPPKFVKSSQGTHSRHYSRRPFYQRRRSRARTQQHHVSRQPSASGDSHS